ncbi:MAG: EAL domain-containing protein [Methylovulum sp.]|nr:EAL domain-containing protein [Methylovulum sp.]
MQDWINFLLDTKEYMPHGFCFLWKPTVLWLTVISNLIIALSYFSIPIALSYFAYKRKGVDVEFKGILILFSLFIFACGATHVLSVVTIWKPIYGLAAVTEAFTALISVLAAVLLWPLIPKALLIPSPSELMQANQQLQDEILYHKETKADTIRLNSDLDRLVKLLRASNQAQLESEQRFRHAVNLSPAAIYTLKPTGNAQYPFKSTYVSDAFLAITGFEPADWYADVALWINRVHPDDLHNMINPMTLLRDDGPLDYQYRFQHKEGTYRWIHDKLIVLRTPEGGIDEIFGAWMDITDYKKTEEELHLAAITFDTLQGIIITDPDEVILRVNKAFTSVTGYSSEEVIGKTPKILNSGRHDQAFFAEMWRQLIMEGKYTGEIWDRRKDGSIYPQWQCITAVKNSAGETTHYVAVFTDISEKKMFEDHIKKLAFYDPLTELPNRRLLLERIELAMVQAKRKNTYAAIIFLDLDRFKMLNDSLGHHVGDELLMQVAHRLKSAVREEDMATRLGGDEFVILVNTNAENIDEATNNTLNVAEKILHTLNQPYLLKNNEHHFGASMGITLFSGACREEPTELIQQADTAMYQSKEKGRNTISFFDQSMQEAADKRLQLENSLRIAIDQQQFVLHYQPQVDLAGKLLSAEALIRWIHPEKGIISPLDFIPIAEETGLIIAIGTWVLQEACRQIKKWGAQAFDIGHVAVNVSSRQFQQHDFVDQVKQAIHDAGILPSQLMIELTESILIENVHATVGKMQLLTEHGISISIDDFGTGYSSLAYLTKFPLSQLKVDQSFVRNINQNTNDEVIVETIIAMAKNLGLNVVAEGVETEQQLGFLVEKGCAIFQGFYFGRPSIAEEFGRR